ncbi:O-6-methylguanine DNA methyltransferase [Archaeoglobus sulfaticallidus PM70-1]|uniref:methylated-DNA--[protein]-cysteine S-methyltransferase n=1 Tax=Archaeoglobus sulfaticallidus PM70-1 TaxID=387631 RepID=N0BJA7_9EURY|nr:methylated-DNA--[protein]-cysteine S-methyltransferase [Archaeoglobus sulfaticallidus]AGK60250.1 O-6-methylguanine DNA methyltransferase [Archaeoglobus sulfaticallidus PM70-1]
MRVISFDLPVGTFRVFLEDRYIVRSGFETGSFGDKATSKVRARLKSESRLENALRSYFDGEVVDLSDLVEIESDGFASEVLKVVSEIPYGKTLTYSQVADRINSRAYRAVGKALRNNPVPVIIPCHRVVAKNGIGGYSSGIEIKKYLLRLEGVEI